MKQDKEGSHVLTFVADLATYYMDFLETNFHKRRTPKRSVKYHDSNGLFLGLNLRKYEGFNAKLWRVINEGLEKNTSLTVRRGQFTTRIPEPILDLIRKQVNSVRDEEIDQILTFSTESVLKSAENHKSEADVALAEALESIQNIVREQLIAPLLSRIEKPIENQSSAGIESIYSIEEGLIDIIVVSLEDVVSECINLLIVDQQVEVPEQLRRAFNLDQVRGKITRFFDNFAINDLFFEIQELVDNKHILDKHDIYLYFLDIQYGKNVYPVFYVPLSIEKTEDIFSINFDSSIYVNKKALEYIVQEFNVEKGRRGSISSIRDRILYPHENDGGFPELVKSIANDIADYFELDSQFELNSSARQVLKSLYVTMSNSCYFNIFDKSDEALVNDYEEILECLSAQDNRLSEIFKKLINDFIKKEPESLKKQIQDEWDDTEISEKLVYSSPIPLNAEQMQVLKAVRNDVCKYITVEGPPGTGKSHTITAMVFDAIRDGRSVLVLSDKKEALDVVEDKITQTLNNVRVTEDFQNPILRLGKAGNTYNQILSTTSITNIRDSYKAVKRNHKALRDNIQQRKEKLQEWIKETVGVYESIGITEIQRLMQLEYIWDDGKICPVDLPELLSADEPAAEIESLYYSCKQLLDILHNSPDGQSLEELFRETQPKLQTYDRFQDFVEFLNILQTLEAEFGESIKVISIFETFETKHLSELKNFIVECEQLKSGIFGFFFKGRKLADLNARFSKQFKCVRIVDFKRDLEIFKKTHEILNLAEARRPSRSKKEEFLQDVDFIRFVHKCLLNPKLDIGDINLNGLEGCLEVIIGFLEAYPASSKSIDLDQDCIESYYENALSKLDDEAFESLVDFLNIRRALADKFGSLPNFNYRKSLSELEELLTHEMTYLLDARLLEFYEKNRSTAKTLKENIRKKKKFPRNEFSKLKEAFPCIIAGIRDYSEYIPLEAEIFDLVIIDEASQVSIAQAFPALLRAKKVVVLGDRKQFSNIKSAQARSDTNRNYLNSLEKSFKMNVSKDISELERLNKFNIKTSILEFFEFIVNFDIMLLKHFRGYREHISYSSKYFYGGNLQAIKMRGKIINEVLKFTFLEHDGKKELIENTNSLEIDVLLKELENFKESETPPTVGIITPHTNQQKLISAEISKLPDRDFYYEKLNLKIMTFDTCQGEERDVVYYSMVASPVSDRLWGIFIKDLAAVDLEESGRIKAQRLNVGFSRVKECMHIILSKPISDFSGSIRQALQHYSNVLEEAKKLPETKDVDASSPMEAKVLDWIKNTKFFQNNSSAIELKAQFPVGEYLKQLDRSYNHPKYRVDFLLIYFQESGPQHNVIIEYDGFKEHFDQTEDVNELNYEHYYKEDDVEREKILEGYGYKFMRINRFNLGEDPVSTLSERLETAVKTRPAGQRIDITSVIHRTVNGIQKGSLKVCPRCGKLQKIEMFLDKSLPTGEGRICSDCKNKKKKRRKSWGAQIRAQEASTVSTSDLKCPRCNSQMIHRTGKYGEFYGCSQFPGCRGTRRCK